MLKSYTYQKNDFRLLSIKNTSYVFYDFSLKFGIYFVYVISNYNSKDNTINVYKLITRSTKPHKPEEKTISIEEFKEFIEPELINSEYISINGIYKEFYRYFKESLIFKKYINTFINNYGIIDSINTLNRCPQPIIFDKENVDRMLNMLNDYNIKYSIEKYIKPWYKDPEFIIPTAMSVIAIIVSIIALFI